MTAIPLEALPLEPEQAAAFAALVMDIPSLVAAVEAVQEAADEMERRRCGCGGSTCSPQREVLTWCAAKVREAITSALTGKETSDGA